MPKIFRPNSKPQSAFFKTTAFETLLGGAAGGGKSLCAVISAAMGLTKPGYNAALFRRTFPELEGADGLISISRSWYPAAGGVYNEQKHIWTFPGNSTIRFGHMANRHDHFQYQGQQFQFVGFDELGHFEEDQYTYLFSRLRSTVDSGIQTRSIATANPGRPWVKSRWAPWVDHKHPNPAKPGELRYFKRVQDGTEIETEPDDPAAWSRTFIQLSWADNPALSSEYKRNLDMLPYIERQRLKYGDWDVAEGKGLILNREWFQVAKEVPTGFRAFRYFDFAASEKKNKSHDPDWTATAVLYTDGSRFYLFVQRRRVTWATAKEWVRGCLQNDPKYMLHGGEEEGGASGKAVSYELMQMASQMGRTWTPIRPDRDKVQRAQQWAPYAEQGNVYILQWDGCPVDDFLTEAHMMPEGAHDDMIDAVSGAFELWRRNRASGVPVVGRY